MAWWLKETYNPGTSSVGKYLQKPTHEYVHFFCGGKYKKIQQNSMIHKQEILYNKQSGF